MINKHKTENVQRLVAAIRSEIRQELYTDLNLEIMPSGAVCAYTDHGGVEFDKRMRLDAMLKNTLAWVDGTCADDNDALVKLEMQFIKCAKMVRKHRHKIWLEEA